jgi:diaminobutyrate-2-oxoglutarate transaminase
MAKSVSGFGLPMALMLVRPEYDIFGPAEHNGTFRGNTHAFVTARVAIEKFWSDRAFQDGRRYRIGRSGERDLRPRL